MNKRLFLIISIVFFALSSEAQEYLIGLGGTSASKNSSTRIVKNDTVATLPFYDDFANDGPYTSAQKWQSCCVFVNSRFPYIPVNQQAATLDLLDENCEVYKNGSTNPFIADSLLSVAISLEDADNQKLTPADSVYLSFYYQAGGNGDCPDTNDSLVLCFGYNYEEEIYDSINNVTYIYEEMVWEHVWSTPGNELDSTFQRVMIPITDSAFFKDKFYILFYNYGTLPSTMYPTERSNMDIWNIDCIYIDKNRSKDDKSIAPQPQVCFTGQDLTFLKRYNTMPYIQYKETSPEVAMNYEYKTYISNLDLIPHDIRYICYVEEKNSGRIDTINDVEIAAVEPYANGGVLEKVMSLNNFRYPAISAYNSTEFTIHQDIYLIDNSLATGDSFDSKQYFEDYFAYDAGVPIKGYGVVPDDSYFATQFNMSAPDKLYGVQLLFNNTFNDANAYDYFDIYVWGNNGGKPGEVLYVLENKTPWWPGYYAYAYYEFDEPINISGTFYVGLRQQEKRSINIGFDTSRDNRQYNFYKVGTMWKNSEIGGSLMIRPVVGKLDADVDENQCVTDNLRLYPNPAGDVLHIEGIDANVCRSIAIFDMTGRIVKEFAYCNKLNISELSCGIYVIKVVNNDGTFAASRFVISK